MWDGIILIQRKWSYDQKRSPDHCDRCLRPETHMSADIWSSRLFVSGHGGHVCFRFRTRHGQIYDTLCGYAYCPYRMSQNVPMILRPLSSILFIVGQRRRIMFGLTQEEEEECSFYMASSIIQKRIKLSSSWMFLYVAI